MFDSPPGVDPAALVAIETDRNTWRGMWTYDEGRVGSIRSHITENF